MALKASFCIAGPSVFVGWNRPEENAGLSRAAGAGTYWDVVRWNPDEVSLSSGVKTE
jgi:hypothetical protein